MKNFSVFTLIIVLMACSKTSTSKSSPSTPPKPPSPPSLLQCASDVIHVSWEDFAVPPNPNTGLQSYAEYIIRYYPNPPNSTPDPLLGIPARLELSEWNVPLPKLYELHRSDMWYSNTEYGNAVGIYWISASASFMGLRRAYYESVPVRVCASSDPDAVASLSVYLPLKNILTGPPWPFD